MPEQPHQHPLKGPGRRDAFGFAVAAEPTAWRFSVLVEIANFTALRRHVGKARAALLAADVATRIDAALSPLTVETISRRAVEVTINGNSYNDGIKALDRIAAAFAAPLDIDGEALRVELVLAGAAGPLDGIEDVRLVEEAEDALQQARTEHRRVLRDTSTEMRAVDKVTLQRELADGIARGELLVMYQPKVSIRRERVSGAEALLRWQHPTRGLIMPGDFIPLAEGSQLIEPLTLWTIERVIADQKELVAAGYDMPVFVNISGQLLGDPDFIRTACDLVSGGGVKIGFEITETAVIRDPESAIAHLRLIAEQGVPIAIDDYGAGLSSLAYLKKLPASELKIDKMFIMELTSSNRDPLIVRSTIDLAHAMEMEVVAEGVETPAALALLSVMGCDIAQGFLLSRPLTLANLRQYLEQDVSRPSTQTNPTFRRPAAFWKAA